MPRSCVVKNAPCPRLYGAQFFMCSSTCSEAFLQSPHEHLNLHCQHRSCASSCFTTNIHRSDACAVQHTNYDVSLQLVWSDRLPIFTRKMTSRCHTVIYCKLTKLIARVLKLPPILHDSCKQVRVHPRGLLPKQVNHMLVILPLNNAEVQSAKVGGRCAFETQTAVVLDSSASIQQATQRMSTAVLAVMVSDLPVRCCHSQS